EEDAQSRVAQEMAAQGQLFAEYIDWRATHPSDDLMTQLLNAEFEDETATRLIGWTGKVLGEHPDQRRQIVADRSLIPNAIEETLRYEAPSPVQARYV